MEQYDATNEILRFLNLTEIDNPKHILKVRSLETWFGSTSIIFSLESILWSLVHTKRRSNHAAWNKENARRVLRPIQWAAGGFNERSAFSLPTNNTKHYRNWWWPIKTLTYTNSITWIQLKDYMLLCTQPNTKTVQSLAYIFVYNCVINQTNMKTKNQIAEWVSVKFDDGTRHSVPVEPSLHEHFMN